MTTSLGERLRQLRRDSHSTVAEIAAAARLPEWYLRLLEDGQSTNPTRWTLDALARVYGVTVADLID